MSPLGSTTAGSARFVQQIRANNDRVRVSLERLSTGKRINHPSDDPAGFVAAEDIRGEIARINGQLKSITKERSLGRLEESTLGNIRKQLIDIRGNVLESAGNLLTDDERKSLSDLIDSSLEAIDRVEVLYQRTAKRLGGDPQAELLPAANKSQLQATKPSTGADLSATQAAVDSAVDAVTSRQLTVALQDRSLEVQQTLAEDMLVTHTEALSQIEAADFAVETSNLVQGQILAQSAIISLQFQTKQYADQVQALLDGVGKTIDATA